MLKLKQSPFDRLKGLKQNWKVDSLSGFIVFLIALPLSLGIAMASGVPPIAGLFAAIIGGLVVSQMSGSFVTINGPAAGLIVVILHGVEVLGRGDPMAGYRAVLAATVISGVILAIAGVIKAGRLGDLFPSSAVHGMLASIGVVIMVKQFHTALGVAPLAKSTFGLIAEIPSSLSNLNPEIAFISAISFVLLIGLPMAKSKWVRMIPAPMVVVLIGIGLGHFFDLEHTHKYLFQQGHQFDVGPKFLVTLPARLTDGVTFPDFSSLFSMPFVMTVFSLTLVQGLETLLSASAVDRFDPHNRKTNLNRDLTAVGVGSALSGLIGGLPMIAEIVRSRANVSNGAQTRWANTFHGAFMLLFVALVPSLIHQIPLATLATILVVTGYRLASPSQFKHTLEIGPEQLLIFTATLVTALATDLLVGVGTGVAVEMLVHLFRGVPIRTLFKPDMSWNESNGLIRVQFRRGAIFSNYLGIKAQLDKIPTGRRVELDLSKADFVDHTVMERLNGYISDYRLGGGTIDMTGLEGFQTAAEHPLAARRRMKTA